MTVPPHPSMGWASLWAGAFVLATLQPFAPPMATRVCLEPLFFLAPQWLVCRTAKMWFPHAGAGAAVLLGLVVSNCAIVTTSLLLAYLGNPVFETVLAVVLTALGVTVAQLACLGYTSLPPRVCIDAPPQWFAVVNICAFLGVTFGANAPPWAFHVFLLPAAFVLAHSVGRYVWLRRVPKLPLLTFSLTYCVSVAGAYTVAAYWWIDGFLVSFGCLFSLLAVVLDTITTTPPLPPQSKKPFIAEDLCADKHTPLV